MVLEGSEESSESVFLGARLRTPASTTMLAIFQESFSPSSLGGPGSFQEVSGVLRRSVEVVGGCWRLPRPTESSGGLRRSLLRLLVVCGDLRGSLEVFGGFWMFPGAFKTELWPGSALPGYPPLVVDGGATQQLPLPPSPFPLSSWGLGWAVAATGECSCPSFSGAPGRTHRRESVATKGINTSPLLPPLARTVFRPRL